MDWEEKDIEFMAKIIGLICDYAVENNLEPDDTLKAVSTNISELLKVSTYNNWSVNGYESQIYPIQTE